MSQKTNIRQDLMVAGDPASRDMDGMILEDGGGGHAESAGRSNGEPRITDPLENHWRTDAELATATRTKATRWPVFLTAFSRTDRTVPD
jgi:hypothetical protein